jgi:hypothetical protein
MIPMGTFWEAVYKGSADGGDVACAVVVEASDHVLVTGHSRGGKTGYDFVTIKYDSSGQRMWVDRYDRGPQKR